MLEKGVDPKLYSDQLLGKTIRTEPRKRPKKYVTSSERGVDGKKVNKKGHMGTPVFWRYYLGSISGDGEKKK